MWRKVSQLLQQHGHDGAEHSACFAQVLPRRIGRAGYWLWLRVVLVVVAVAQRSCPVSGLLGDQWLVAAVAGGVIGDVVLPAAPDHSEPGPGQDADGVGVAMATGSGLLVEVSRPGVVVAGVTGEVHDRGAQLLVTGKAEHDLLVLARLPGRWGRPGQGGQRLGVGEPGPAVADLGQQRGRANPA